MCGAVAPPPNYSLKRLSPVGVLAVLEAEHGDHQQRHRDPQHNPVHESMWWVGTHGGNAGQLLLSMIMQFVVGGE